METESLMPVLHNLKIHDHLCLLYQSPEEKLSLTAAFLNLGLGQGEKCVAIVDDAAVLPLRDALSREGIGVGGGVAQGSLVITTTQDICLSQAFFNPNRMFEFLEKIARESKAQGYAAVRATCDMTGAFRDAPDAERLIEYKNRISGFFADHEVLGICQYNLNHLPPEHLQPVLSTHPFVMSGGFIWKSPFYIPPDDRIPRDRATYQAQRLLQHMQELGRTQEELRKSEERFRKIFEYAAEGILVAEVDTMRFKYANPAICAMLGYTEEELKQKSIPLLHPLEDIEKRFKNASRKSTVDEMEIPCIRKDGSVIKTKLRVSKLQFDSIAYTAAFIIDITGQKKMEEDLRKAHEELEQRVMERTAELERANEQLSKSEQRFRQLTESLTNYIFTVELNNEQVIRAMHSPGCLTVTGYAPEDFQSNYFLWIDMVHPDDQQMVIEKIVIMLESSHSIPVEYRIFHKDGGIRWVRNTIVPHYDTQGSFVSYDGLISDITERKLVENALRESEARFRAVIESTPDAVITTYEDWKIMVWNKGAEKMYGYDSSEVLGRTIDFLMPEYTRQTHADILRKNTIPGKYFISQKYITAVSRKKDGTEFPVEMSMSSWTANDRMYYTNIIRDITDRQRFEEALKASEERYRTVADFTYDWEYWTDIQGNYLYVSPSFEHITGYKVDDLINNRISRKDIIHPDDRGLVADHMTAELCKEEPDPIDFRIITRSGEERWIGHRCCQVHTPDGRSLGIRGSNRDITERKKMEEMILKNQALLKESQRVACLGSWERDCRTGIVTWTEEIYTIFEWSPQLSTPSHETFLDRVHPDDREMVWQTFRDALRRKVPYECTYRLLFPDGRIKYIFDHCETYYDRDCTPLSTIGTFQDITARMQSYQALMESEQQLSGILMAITDYLCMLDENLTVIWANDMAIATFGRDLVGKKCGQMHSCEDTSCEFCDVKECINGLIMTEHESTARAYDGRQLYLWCRSSIAARYDDGRAKFIIHMSRDITEWKLVQDEAMREAHLASIGELAAGVAHEINNPIMAIINCTQLIVDEYKAREEDPDIAERVLREGYRVSKIIRNLLSFAREEEDEYPLPADIREIFHDSFSLYAKQFQKNGIIVKQNFDEDVPHAIVRQHKIQQVFVNLLSNAFYALNQKYAEWHQEKILEVSAHAITVDTKPFVHFVFHDHGTGIPERIMDKICNPFFSTKPKGEGTGLGLSISHTIIKNHGGRLLFDSCEGQYAKVIVDLPAVQADSSVTDHAREH